MRRLVLSMAAVFLLVMQAVAQTGGIVAGVLKEKASGMPMEFATVVLYGAKSQQVVSGSMTDSIGRFIIEKVSAGQYYVEGNYVGCKSVKSGVFSVEKGKTTNIGTTRWRN